MIFAKLSFATLVLSTTLVAAKLAPTLSMKCLTNSADLIFVGANEIDFGEDSNEPAGTVA